jgi:hypothetical protein
MTFADVVTDAVDAFAEWLDQNPDTDDEEREEAARDFSFTYTPFWRWDIKEVIRSAPEEFRNLREFNSLAHAVQNGVFLRLMGCWTPDDGAEEPEKQP